METVFCSVDGCIEDAVKAINNAGFSTGLCEKADDGCWNIDVDLHLIDRLFKDEQFEFEYNGTTVNAEMP